MYQPLQRLKRRNQAIVIPTTKERGLPLITMPGLQKYPPGPLNTVNPGMADFKGYFCQRQGRDTKPGIMQDFEQQLLGTMGYRQLTLKIA